MRSIFVAAIFSLTAIGLMGCASGPKPVVKTGAAAVNVTLASTNILSDEKSRASYAIGMLIGHGWQQNDIDVDLALFVRGLEDAWTNGTTLMTPQEMQATLRQYQQTILIRQTKIRAEQALTNKAAGEAFLATNKDNPGVITLPDGLQYQVITNGSGATPTADSMVTVNYRGTFLNGAEFDSSAKVNHPIQFPANRVIHGWTEALTRMKVGSKWRLFIPSDLAYGEQGFRGIPPNSTLIFEIELLDTKELPPQPAAAPAAPLTSDIIKVPSADEMKKGAKIEALNAEEVQQMQSQSQTNH
jgi:FKBP-type peptidyl-prolyl cis-trans isomerase